MKKIFLLFLLSFHCHCAFSQWGLKISHIRPTGGFGMAMKPTVGGELIFKALEEESGFNIRGSLGFVKCTPRIDTLRMLGMMYGSSGQTALPGYQVFHRFNLLTFSVGGDYMFNLNDQFRLYPGLDVGALINSLSYDSYTPTVITESYEGGYAYMSLRLRAGAEFLITEDIAIFGEFTRSMNYSPKTGRLAYNDYGLGARFNF